VDVGSGKTDVPAPHGSSIDSSSIASSRGPPKVRRTCVHFKVLETIKLKVEITTEFQTQNPAQMR
jgi:hypothetical protein